MDKAVQEITCEACDNVSPLCDVEHAWDWWIWLKSAVQYIRTITFGGPTEMSAV